MGYRDEKRADDAQRREQDRQDAALRMDKQLEAQRIAAEEKRKAADAAAERKQKAADAAAERQRKADAEKQRLKRQAKAQRKAAWEKRIRWVRDNGDVAAVLAVMFCGMLPALVAQFGALRSMGMGLLLAGLLPFLLELGAWAATAGEAKALREKRSVTPYRITVWTFTALAATVNAIHGYKDFGGVGGALVLAASSIAPVALWHMVMAGRHSQKAKRTKAEIAEEKRRREEAKEKARHLKQRRRHHPKVAKEADRLLSAATFDSMTAEEAFAAAWRIIHGTEPGMTPELYKIATASRLRVGEAFEVAEEKRPEMIRAGLMTGLLSPVPRRLSDGLPVLGPSVPLPALPAGRQGATAQAGIGSFASGAPSPEGAKNGSADGSGDSVGTAPKRRSDEELEQLLPQAHEHAADLVAEGKQISAASLAKRMQIRREDGMWLRDRVIAERKLRVVGE
ncbi:DUF2637 domain-containing protein [Streptomyces zaomyceticus]|uniref:DUF2637 domain-containing protein n=1 Tax=Streptomyces zaomyceticus TaxID=68286 RepID=UPI00371A74CF